MGTNKIASRILSKKLKIREDEDDEEEVINLTNPSLNVQDESSKKSADEIFLQPSDATEEETQLQKFKIEEVKEEEPLPEVNKSEKPEEINQDIVIKDNSPEILLNIEINEGGKKMEEKDKKLGNDEIQIEDDEFLKIDTPLPTSEKMKSGSDDDDDLQLDDIFLDYHNDNVEDPGFQFEKPLPEEIDEKSQEEEILLIDDAAKSDEEEEKVEEKVEKNKIGDIEFELDDPDDSINGQGISKEEKEEPAAAEKEEFKEPEVMENKQHDGAFGFRNLITSRFRHNNEEEQEVEDNIVEPVKEDEEEFKFEDTEETPQEEQPKAEAIVEDPQPVEEDEEEFKFEDIEETPQEEQPKAEAIVEDPQPVEEDEEEFKFEDIEETPQEEQPKAEAIVKDPQPVEKVEQHEEELKFEIEDTEETPQEEQPKAEAIVEDSQPVEKVEQHEEELKFEIEDTEEAPKEELPKVEHEEELPQAEPVKEEDEILDAAHAGTSPEEENDHKFGENEKIIAELINEYSNLRGMDSSLHEFLVHNMGWLTKERISICLDDEGISLEDYKDFLLGQPDESRKAEIYEKMRELEIQYLFEDINLEFDLEDFTRKRTTIDGKSLKNAGILKSSVEIDVFDVEGDIKQVTIQEGEYAFILSDKLELNIQNYVDEIKTAKLNCDDVLIITLKGAIVDSQEIKEAERLGVKIVQMGIPISKINKDLEKLRKKIIA